MGISIKLARSTYNADNISIPMLNTIVGIFNACMRKIRVGKGEIQISTGVWTDTDLDCIVIKKHSMTTSIESSDQPKIEAETRDTQCVKER
jgi:hypothetical protein